MPVNINADTVVGGAVVTADASGVLALQAAGSTQVTVANTGVTLANALPAGSGGTGLTSPGASGNVLTSNGTAWTSAVLSVGNLTATANGSISSGAPVTVNSDGSVSVVTDSIGTVVVQSTSAGQWVGSVNVSTTNAAIDPNTNTILAVFSNSGGNATAIVGTCNFTNNTITWGSVSTVGSGYSTSSMDVVWDTIASRFVVVVANSTSTGVAAVPVISGTSITSWSEATFQSNWVAQLRIVNCPAQSCNIVCYSIESGAAFYGAACVISGSGTTINVGAVANFSGTTSYIQSPDLTWDNNAQRVVISYRNNGPFAQRAVVGTVSGTSLSFGSEVVVTTYNSAPRFMVYDVPSTRVVIGYTNSAGTNSVYSICTVSGSTITIGAQQNLLPAGGTVTIRSYSRVSGSSFVLATLASNGANMIYYSASVSGSALSVSGAVNSGTTASSNSMSATAYSTSSKRYVQLYQISTSSNPGNTMILSQSNMGVTFLGFSAASYTNGQTATINTIGGTNTAQTSLTPGSFYYVTPAGAISTSSSGNVFAGTARSATSILVKG